MKNLFVLLVITLFCLQLNAQDSTRYTFSSGDVYVSGALGLAVNVDESSNPSYTLGVDFGFFISDNVSLGIGGFYSKDWDVLFGLPSLYDNLLADYENVVGGNVFVKFHQNIGKRFYVYEGINLTYSKSVDSDNSSFYTDVSAFDASASLGLNYFLSPHFILDARFGILGYTNFNYDGAYSNNIIRFGIEARNIDFGFIYKF